jgi:hypothetical protein
MQEPHDKEGSEALRHSRRIAGTAGPPGARRAVPASRREIFMSQLQGDETVRAALGLPVRKQLPLCIGNLIMMVAWEFPQRVCVIKDRPRSNGVTLRTWRNVSGLRLAKRNVGDGCYGANAHGNRAPGYPLGQWDVPPYNRRVKITMSVTLAPELSEAIKESAGRQGLSFDDWIAAAAELKFRADDEAAVFEEAERKRRAAALREALDEYQSEFGAFTDEEMAEARRERLEAHRIAEEYWAQREAEDQ